ncbi:hypothetical protein [Mucilaginibacter sp. SP1R1]|uniref:hypothetical protein n=1 Tax=Mucilaginibacter sp. SP1R1 TaxID=2723091 RepID=UPI00161832A6|nr:hypothetical protein [Mucilaginibacter sp. SP1R1]MBB6149493.1 chromosome segregation ATPase [Mucilaginibacter sp. SP1R1]
MGVKVSGGQGGGLNFTANLDIAQALKNAETFKKTMSDLSVTANGISKGLDSEKTATQGVTDAINKQRLAILEANKAKADANAQVAKERAAQAELNTQIKQNTLARQAELAATRAQASLDRERAKQAAAQPRTFISETAPTNIDPLGQTTGAFDNSKTLAQLEAEIAALQAAKAQIESFYQAGTIGAETYQSAVSTLTAKEAELTAAIEGYGAASVTAAESTTAATAAIETELGAIEGLKLALKELNAQKLLANESDLPVLNREIQAVELEIRRLGNVGREGFDSVGNAITTTGQATVRSTNFFKQAWSALRQIAYVLPGIGIAGILAFVTGPIIEYISQLDIFKTKITQIKSNLDAFNEVNKNFAKDAGTQASNLRILYKATTDVNNSIVDRTKAARELQREFPDTFANSKILAILNGKEKQSYDDLTESVLKTARAKAVADKLAVVEAQSIELDIQKQKVLNAQQNKNAQEVIDVFNRTKSGLVANAKNYGKPLPTDEDVRKSIAIGQTKSFAEGDDVISRNNKLAADALKDLDNKKKLLKGTADFLTQYAGGNNAVAKGIVKSTTVADLKKNNAYLKELQAAQEELLNAQKSIQERIKEFTDKKESKVLDPDQSALTAISDQFGALEFQIGKANDKYDAFVKKFGAKAVTDFNANPANGVKLTKTDPAILQDAENTAIDNQANLNENKFIAEDLEKKKKLYDEYENYKVELGSEVANKEYAELLQSGKDFGTYINNIIDSVDKADISGPIQQRQEQLKKASQANADELAKIAKDQYRDAYQSALTNSQAILGIEEDYQRKVKALGKDATQEQLDNLKLQRDARIRNENESNAYAKGGFEKLMQHYDELTRGQILNRLEAIKAGYQKEYEEGKLNADQLAKLSADVNSKIANLNGADVFKKVTDAIKDYRDQVKLTGKDSEGAKEKQQDMFSSIAAAAEAVNEVIGELASSFEQLGIGGQGLQDTLKGVMGVVGGLGKISDGLAKKDPVAIITGSIGLLTSAISLFSHKDKDLQKKIDGYQRQLNSLSQAYKLLDAQVQNAVGESIYSDQDAQIKNLQAQQAKLTQMRDAEASKKKADQSKIDDYNNQIADIPNQINDINKAISQNLIQTTFKDLSKSLSDAFEDAFASGEDSAKKFEDVFNQVIVNAVKNSLQLKLLDPIISDFTDDLTEYAKAHDNSVVGFDFDTWKKAIKEKGDLYTQGLEAIKDYLPDPNDASQTTAQGQIAASITEDTATRLYGVFAGTQTATLQVRDILTAQGKTMGDLYQSAQGSFAQLVMIEANTRRGADNTDGLIPALKEIINNTKGTSLRGSGLV